MSRAEPASPLAELLDAAIHLPPHQRAELLALATNYALAKGLLFAGPSQRAPLATALHAPFALLPAPFPRSLFERARALQPLYNLLYARVAADHAFLEGALSEVGRADPFVAQLWKIWCDLRAEGIKQARAPSQRSPADPPQPLQLGLFRSDYLLQIGEQLSFRQVEFNTIASSFGGLSSQTSQLHKYGLLAGS